MIITRGLNPYVTPGRSARWTIRCCRWRTGATTPTHYGPVFTGALGDRRVGRRRRPVGTALAFKTLATAFGALAAWAASRSPGTTAAAACCPCCSIAWNPIALIETAGSGHNEMVMMGLALLGMWVIAAGPNERRLRAAGCVGARQVDHGGAGWAAWSSRTCATSTARAPGARAGDQVRGHRGRGHRRRLRAVLGGLGSIGALRAADGRGTGIRRRRTRTPAALLPFAAVVALAFVVVARNGRRWLLELAAVVSLGFVTFMFPWVLPWYLLPAAALLAVGPLFEG